MHVGKGIHPYSKASSKSFVVHNSQHFRRHLKRFLFIVQPTFYFGAKNLPKCEK
jgi:hypothetical protein